MTSTQENGLINLSIALVGHVDCGKSTVGGHLLYKLGEVEEETLKKYERESSDRGMGSFMYSWILSKTKAERERGITIDISHAKFLTDKYHVTLIDCSGHRDFIGNMITGSSQSDAAILIIDASLGGFEAGISNCGQTREHALITYVQGVRQLIVAVNKMDFIGYREQRFDKIVNSLRKELKSIGYDPRKIPFIPISGWTGENLTTPQENMEWWKKGKSIWGGMTLLDIIETLECPKREIEKPLRIPISNSYRVDGIGTVVVGCLESGSLEAGMVVVFSPSGATSKVASIEKHYQTIDKAIPRDIVGISVPDIHDNSIIRRGHVCGELKNDPPITVESFTAQIVILNHPGKIQVGYTPIVDCHASHISCRIEKIIEKRDKRTLQSLGRFPDFLVKGDAALVVMIPSKQMVVDCFRDNPKFGRFIMRDMRRIIGVGVIKEVKKAKPKFK